MVFATIIRSGTGGGFNDNTGVGSVGRCRVCKLRRIVGAALNAVF